MSRLSSWIGSIAFLGAALAVLAATIFPGPGEDSGTAGAPDEEQGSTDFRFAVTTRPITSGEVVETVPLVGDVVSARRATLAFERPGRLAEVLVDLGDAVREGQVLARLDDSVLREEVAVAHARALAAAVEASFAEREAARTKEAGAKAVSEASRDRSDSDARTARIRTDESLADVRRLEARLHQGELRAPFRAWVTRRLITQGSYVQAGAAAFEIVDLDHREVHLEIPALIAEGLPRLAPVTLTLDGRPGWTVEARLDTLVPAADAGSRTFRGVVRLGDLDPDRILLPGMFVRAAIRKRRVVSPTIVPADALVEGPRGTIVVVVRGEQPPAATAGEVGRLAAAEASPAPPPVAPPAPIADFVPVRVLARGETKAAVESLRPGALAPGLSVLVTGADNVFPGAPLHPTPHPEAPAPGS